MISLDHKGKHMFGGENRTRTYHKDPKVIRTEFRDEDGHRGPNQRKKSAQNVRTFNEKFNCSQEPNKIKKRRPSKSDKSNHKRNICKNI